MKKQFFDSVNEERGILLEKKGEELSISIWKKEIPVTLFFDKETSLQISNFIIDNLKGVNNDEEKINYWLDHIKNFGNPAPKEPDKTDEKVN